MQNVQTYQLPIHFRGGGGGKLPNAKHPNLPTTNSFLGVVVVVVVNYQTQNVQTYQLPTHFHGGGGGGVSGGKLPNAKRPKLPTTNSFPG